MHVFYVMTVNTSCTKQRIVVIKGLNIMLACP